jgi:uridine kinase
MPTRPIVIAIAGCSGSGKTTLARELATQLDATLFPLDLYYRDLTQFPFDHPDSLESELFIAHIHDLAQGHTIQRPIYDFATHSRVAGAFENIVPTRYVLVEGILALHYPELLPLYDFSIYVDAPDEVCLARRIHRDMRERGRTEQNIRDQFNATAQPMAEIFVKPSQTHAALTVSGLEALDWSIEQILHQLHTHKLLT